MKQLSIVMALIFATARVAQSAEADVVIYGATASGVAAAVQASRMGKTVLLIEPGRHVGGLTTGGLGWTDAGNHAVVGGIAREFYQAIKTHYDRPDSWPRQRREEYPFYRAKDDTMWAFEPKVAEAILRKMLAEAKVEVAFGERLDRTAKGIKKTDQRIVQIQTESGKVFTGKVFIDATYEGDLMALAGVSFAVGREANATYGERYNGVARAFNTHTHRFMVKVDPYRTPGDSTSGVVFGVEPKPLGADGTADDRIQAYCFRMCMSDDPANRVPFEKPADFDEAKYELLFRNFEAGDMRVPFKPDRMPNRKTDTNNNCAVSTDFIGQNYAYPTANYAERERIVAAHLSYQRGLMWALQSHPRVPEKVRAAVAKWGLAKDEFTDTDYWPHQLYVREARRMLGAYIQTERDCTRSVDTPYSIGMGSYNMDSHNCARTITPEGFVQNEGDVQQSPGGPYRISYGAILPKATECENLLVPVCLSSSHIAFGSIRMEPVFMILGQSAATAAALAIDTSNAVQRVPYEKLRAKLFEDKQVLQWTAPAKP